MVLLAEYNIQMNQLNSSGTYDTLYPITFNPTTGAMYGGLTNDNDIFSLLSKSMLFTPSNLPPVTLADLDEGALFSYGGLLLAKLTAV